MAPKFKVPWPNQNMWLAGVDTKRATASTTTITANHDTCNTNVILEIFMVVNNSRRKETAKIKHSKI